LSQLLIVLQTQTRGELCRVRCIIGIVRDENLGKARERKNALDLIVAMANFHRTGERWFGLGIRARDLTLIPSWEDGGMISGVAWRGARFRPCGTGARRRPWSVRRHGEKPGAGALPLPALRGFSSPSHGRAPPPPPSRSAAALDLGRLSHARVRLLLSRRCRLHWAGRVRRAQQNDADVVFALARLRAVSHGPFEAHWHSKRLMFFFFSHSSVLPCSLNDFNLCCGVASP